VQLDGRAAVVYLIEQGFQSIGLLLGLKDPMQGKVCRIVGSDEFGLWISPEGEEWRRTVGIPWPFIAAVEMDWEKRSPAGLGDARSKIGFEA